MEERKLVGIVENVLGRRLTPKRVNSRLLEKVDKILC